MDFGRFETRVNFVSEAHELAGVLEVVDEPAEGEQWIAQAKRIGKKRRLTAHGQLISTQRHRGAKARRGEKRF
jgi:hypothetical protein